MNYLIAALVPMLWGSTYSAVNLYLEGFSPYWVAVWRALPAGIILLLICRRRLPLPLNQMLSLSFLNITAFFLLLFIAAYRLPGSVAGTLGATFPLQLILLQWLREGQRPSLQTLSFAVLGLAGVVLLLNPTAEIDWIGAGAMLLGTLLMAQSSIWMKKWQTEDVMGLTAWQLTLGGIMLIPFAFFIAGPPQPITQHAVPGLIWVVILNTAFGYWAYVRSIKLMGPNKMSIIMFMNPVTAVFMGVFLVNEVLASLQWIGIVLIFASLIMSNYYGSKLTNKTRRIKPACKRRCMTT